MHARAFLAPLLLLSAHAQVAPPVAAPTPDVPSATAPKPASHAPSSQWVFRLLPKSLQQNPNLELTVITEMTDDGAERPAVTPEHPAYFITQSMGAHGFGDPSADEKILPQADVEGILTKSLAANGYRPAREPDQPPSLAVFYTWGSHKLLHDVDEENPAQSAEQVARNLLDRAALVGGEKFAGEMRRIFTAEETNASATPTTHGPDMGPGMEFIDPMNAYRMKRAKNEFLVDQMADDVYFVVASAYDYRTLGQKPPTLLWRTRMTVASRGVSQDQALPTLVASAAPYFGREMDDVEILTKRAVRDGKVEIGTPTVVSPATAADPPPRL